MEENKPKVKSGRKVMKPSQLSCLKHESHCQAQKLVIEGKKHLNDIIMKDIVSPNVLW